MASKAPADSGPALPATGNPTGGDKSDDGTLVDPPVPTGQTDGSLIPLPTKKGGSPTQIKPVPAPGTKGWTKTAMKATDIAKKMDKAFSQLAGVENRAKVLFVLPYGSGQMALSSQWRSPNVFSVEYPATVGGHPVVETVRANGSMMGRLLSQAPGKSTSQGNEAWVDLQPLPKVVNADGKSLLETWPTDMPGAAFGRFVKSRDVFSPLVNTLLADPTLDVVTEERTKPYGRVLLTDYRIVAKRKESQIEAKGDLQFEIVVDAEHFVPVTMRTRFGEKGKKVTEIDWAGQWIGGKFPDKKFQLPKTAGA